MTFINRGIYHIVAYVLFAAVALTQVLSFAQSVRAQEAGAGGGGLIVQQEEVQEYPFKLTKNISDNKTPDPYTANEFKFHVTGNDIDIEVDLTAHTDDTAEEVIFLPAGTYTVEEIGPDGFIPDDWTVQWSGHGCSGDTGNGPIRSIDIVVEEAEDPDAGGNVCRADNQWRPEDDDEPDNGDGDTGVLEVTKVITGTTTIAFDVFSFEYSGISNGTIEFEADGTNMLAVATGTYSITEVPVSGYTASYSNCTNVVVTAGATTTCTITNTLVTNGNGGGNGDDEEYLVFGYVWHDENENEEWEQEDENDLDGWTVEITNGSTTMATTTDEAGYYFFNVPAGEWTINQEVMEEWSQTFPSENGHVVTVGDEELEVTLKDEENLLAMIVRYFLPIAHAQSVIEYGPFNFGNVQFGSGGCPGCGGGNNNGDDDDDGDSDRVTSSGSSGSSGGTGGGEILGEQVSIVPVAAANAGFGGAETKTMDTLLILGSFFAAMIAWIGVRHVR